MSAKTLIMLGLAVGSTLGSYLPTLFGVDAFSMWSIIGGAVGGILGVYVGYKIADNWML